MSARGESAPCYIKTIEGPNGEPSLMIEIEEGALQILPDGFFTIELSPETDIAVADRLARELRDLTVSFGYTDMSGIPKAP